MMLELILKQLFYFVKFCSTICSSAILLMPSCLPASFGITGLSSASALYSANGSPSIKQNMCSTAHAEITAHDLHRDILSPLRGQKNLLFIILCIFPLYFGYTCEPCYNSVQLLCLDS